LLLSFAVGAVQSTPK